MRLITNSEIKALFMCPRNHHLGFTRGLTPKRKKIYFDEGAAGHSAFQAFYSGKSIEEAIGEFDKIYDGHMKSISAYPEDHDKAVTKFLRLRAMIVAYLEKVGKKDMEAYDTSHVEEEFVVPIIDLNGNPMPDVMFAGKLDGIWTEREGNKVSMLVEHKFYSSFNETDNVMYLDQQVTLYALAAAIKFGVKVPVTLYNVCTKPKNERTKSETPDEFFYRIYELASDPKNAGNYFKRVPVTRGPQHFRVAREILYNAALVITGQKPLPYLYRNVGDHCLWLCPFKQICIEEDPRVLEQMYEPKKKLHPELETVEA